MKIRKNGVVLLGIIGVLVTTAAVVAASSMRRFDARTQTCRVFTRENAMAGYLTFHGVCKSCHSRENNKGAPFLHSESKTQRGWSRVFEEMYPECAKNGSWGSLSEEDLLNLNDYLYVDAANHFDPNAVGSCFG